MKNRLRGISPSVWNEMSGSMLWGAEEYEVIVNRMLREGREPFISDYSYETDSMVRALDMGDIIQKDPIMVQIESTMSIGMIDYLGDLRKRELILQHLIPLLEQLPTFELLKGKVIGKGGVEFDEGVSDQRIVNLCISMMWAAACSTVGHGAKLVSIDHDLLYLDPMKSDGHKDAMISALDNSYDGVRQILAVFETVRGENLRKILEGMFQRNKEALLAPLEKKGMEIPQVWRQDIANADTAGETVEVQKQINDVLEN